MSETPTKTPPRRYLGPTGYLVGQRLERLQKAFLAGRAHARGDLAELRRAANRPPGAVPEVWALTEVPGGDPAGMAPTPAEWAVHIALTLYGMHQQGRSVPVYVEQVPFGAAVRRLLDEGEGGGEPEQSSTWRRFIAVMMASDIEGTREHLEAIIGQMHSAKRLIGFDYAALADDLVQLQYPGGPERVRLKWQRDFYGTRTPKPQPTQTQDEQTRDKQ